LHGIKINSERLVSAQCVKKTIHASLRVNIDVLNRTAQRADIPTPPDRPPPKPTSEQSSNPRFRIRVESEESSQDRENSGVWQCPHVLD
jgi:hypothetical protein